MEVLTQRVGELSLPLWLQHCGRTGRKPHLDNSIELALMEWAQDSCPLPLAGHAVGMSIGEMALHPNACGS